MFNWRRKNRFQGKTRSSRDKDTAKRRLSPAHQALIKQLLYGLLTFVVVGGLIYGVWYVTRLPSLTIAKVEVVGGQTIEPTTLENITHVVLDGHYFKLIPRRFAYLYPEEEIVTALKELDRIKNIEVERTDQQTLTVIFEEYVPYALWCDLKATEDCLFIDQTGFAYTKAPELRGGALVRYESIGRSPKEGEAGFTKEEIEYTRWFVEMLEEVMGLYAVSVALDTESDAYFYLSGGGLLITSMREDRQETFENLLTILESEEFDHLEPGNFQYVDLRFGNKIFVNEELPTEHSTSTATSSELLEVISNARP